MLISLIAVIISQCTFISKQQGKWKWLSHVRLFATPWTVAHQAPLSMGILQARILEWVAMPSSRDLPNSGMEPRSPTLQVDSLPWVTREAQEPIRNTNAQALRPTESETLGVVFPEIYVLMTWSLSLNTVHRICIFRWCWCYLSLDHSLELLVYTTVF